MRLSVILPARNEEELIEKTIKNIQEYFSEKKYKSELIIVLNGCNDKTEAIVNLSKSINNLKIVVLKSKAGYGLALKKGLQSSKGKYVAIFNVDFYDLKMLDLVDIDLYGRDLVIGSKMAHWSEDKRSMDRKIFSYVYNFLLKLLFKFKGSDTHGIKIMRRNVVEKVLRKCKTISGIMDTEFVIKAQREGFKIADFPVVVEEKRIPRFSNRLLSTPVDVYSLYKSLK